MTVAEYMDLVDAVTYTMIHAGFWCFLVLLVVAGVGLLKKFLKDDIE